LLDWLVHEKDGERRVYLHAGSRMENEMSDLERIEKAQQRVHEARAYETEARDAAIAALKAAMYAKERYINALISLSVAQGGQ
jgi:hypothetical protein